VGWTTHIDLVTRLGIVDLDCHSFHDTYRNTFTFFYLQELETGSQNHVKEMEKW